MANPECYEDNSLEQSVERRSKYVGNRRGARYLLVGSAMAFIAIVLVVLNGKEKFRMSLSQVDNEAQFIIGNSFDPPEHSGHRESDRNLEQAIFSYGKMNSRILINWIGRKRSL